MFTIKSLLYINVININPRSSHESFKFNLKTNHHKIRIWWPKLTDISTCIFKFEMHVSAISSILTFCTHMTLIFDPWPCKPFQQFPLTSWIFVVLKFHWNPSTKKKISSHAKQVDRWTAQPEIYWKLNVSAAYCWRRNKNCRHKYKIFLTKVNYEMALNINSSFWSNILKTHFKDFKGAHSIP